MALYLAGSQLLRTPRLYPEARFQVSDRFGMLTAPLAGAAFAFGWSPCLGPVIAAVFGVAATQTGVRAFALLIAYSLGMGVSFLLVGLAFGRVGDPARLREAALQHAHARVGRAARGLRAPADVRPLWWLSAQLTNFLDSLGLEQPRRARLSRRAIAERSAGAGGVCQNRSPADFGAPA